MKWVYSNRAEREVAFISLLNELSNETVQANTLAIEASSKRLVATVKNLGLNTVETFIALYAAIETLAGENPKAMKAAFTLNASSREVLLSIHAGKVAGDIMRNNADKILKDIFGGAEATEQGEGKTLTKDELLSSLGFASGGVVEGHGGIIGEQSERVMPRRPFGKKVN